MSIDPKKMGNPDPHSAAHKGFIMKFQDPKILQIEELRACMPYAKEKNILRFYPHLAATMQRFKIDAPGRKAAYIAQITHESGSLRYTREIYSGERYDVGRLAMDLGNTPENDGDGEMYRGRGLIQITGRFNYARLSQYFAQPFLTFPERLEEPLWATLSSGWFWEVKNLNKLADAGNFRRITKVINGGYNGWDDRVEHWERAKKVFTI